MASSAIWIEIVIVILLAIGNGVLAMSEIAVVSARKTLLRQRAGEGDDQARTALELAEAPNRFLSTVQIGITLVGVLSGAFGGVTLAEIVRDYVAQIPTLAPYSRPVGVGVVVLVVTYLTLVIGELVPKRLALNDPERVAASVARPMQLLSQVTYPLVRLLSVSTEAVLRVLGAQASEEPAITEEEIRMLVAQGTEAGVIEEAEQDMVDSVFRLGERRVSTLMTPRPDIVWLDLTDSLDDIRHKVRDAAHSRFPVSEGDLDAVLGVAYAKDLLAHDLAGGRVNLRAMLRQPVFVPENARALKLLESFKRAGTHIALVVNEFGGIEGLVTVHDVLEAIVGYVPDADRSYDPGAIQRADGSWLVDGMLPIDEFKDLLDISQLPEEEKASYETVAGFVMMRLGQVPSAGDRFDWHVWAFEVVDMDGRRVDKVLVQEIPASG
jgi:putative hemolysin